MSFYECYCDDCRSEADEIIEEARDKLVDLITEQANSEIKAILDNNKRLTKTNEELRQTNAQLKENCETAKAELDKITKLNNQIINPDFKVGDIVYYCVVDTWKRVNCPICNGRGYINVEDKAFGTLTAECPNCSRANYNRRQVDYCTYKVKQEHITGIIITIKDENTDVQYEYKISGYDASKTKSELYKTREEAQTVVNEKNIKVKENATKKANGEEEQ